MKVPFLDLKATYSELKTDLDSAYQRVMSSGHFIAGPELAAFEREYALYTGSKHCAGLANGMDAIQIGLEAVGIGRGDEVIVPSHTFIATWFAVSQLGAVPVPVDIDPVSLQLTAKGIEKALSPQTKAIVPVCLYGCAEPIAEIHSLAKRHGLKLVVDAAQAHGSKSNQKKLGEFGDCVAYSFYPGKNLGAFGDAGALCTNDQELDARVRILRNYGSQKKYFHQEVGLNSRLDELQASFLRVKLIKLDEWNKRRSDIARQYLDALSGLESIKLPSFGSVDENSWHLFPVLCHDRSKVESHLLKREVQTLIHYPIACHLAEAYRTSGYKQGMFPVAEHVCESVLSLPIGPHMNADQVNLVKKSLLELG